MTNIIKALVIVAASLAATTLPTYSDEAITSSSPIQMAQAGAKAPEFRGLTNWMNIESTCRSTGNSRVSNPLAISLNGNVTVAAGMVAAAQTGGSGPHVYHYDEILALAGYR